MNNFSIRNQSPNKKQLSKKGLDLIKKWEGLRLEVYLDSAGHPTIGYGHKIKINEKLPRIIAKEDAEMLLKQDIKWAEDAVNRLVKTNITQNQFDALVSFVYNVGETNFRKSTLLKRINNRDFNDAAEQFLRWIYITKNGKKLKLNGLLNRRLEEVKLFEGINNQTGINKLSLNKNRNGDRVSGDSLNDNRAGAIKDYIIHEKPPKKPIIKSKTVWSGLLAFVSGVALAVEQLTNSIINSLNDLIPIFNLANQNNNSLALKIIAFILIFIGILIVIERVRHNKEDLI